FVPPFLYLMSETVFTEGKFRKIVLNSIPWWIFSACLSLICYSNSFILYDADSTYPRRGISYLCYSGFTIFAYVFLISSVILKMKYATGIKKIEVYFLILNPAIAAVLVAIVTITANIFGIPFIKGLR